MEDGDIKEVKFELKVPDITNLVKFNSKVIVVRGEAWTIEVSKHEKTNRNGEVSQTLALHLDMHADENNNRACVAGLNAKLISSLGADENRNATIGPELFDTNKTRNSAFIPWNVLTNPDKAFIQNNKCIFDMVIWANQLYTYNIGIEEIQSGSDGGSHSKFVVQVMNIRRNLFAFSQEILVNDIPWRIVVFLKDGQDPQLVGRLQCLLKRETDWSCVARMSCKVKTFGSEMLDDMAIKPEPNYEPPALKEKFDATHQEHSMQIMSQHQLFLPENGFVIDGDFFMDVEINVEESTGTEKRGTKRRANDEESDGVAICTLCDEKLAGLQALETKCFHVFCAECINRSLEQAKRCPTCRKALTPKQLHPVYLTFK